LDADHAPLSDETEIFVGDTLPGVEPATFGEKLAAYTTALNTSHNAPIAFDPLKQRLDARIRSIRAR
jgi:hypothetical protein